MDSYKVIELYRNVVDAYTIDMFVENHWNTIPSNWRTAFSIHGVTEWLNILNAEKPLSKLYPLSFLCLRQYFVMIMKRRSPLTPKQLGNALNIPITETQYLHVASKENIRRRVKQKKQHEIDRLIFLIKKIHETKAFFNFAVDVGAGIGHLSRMLAVEIPNLKVMAIEANSQFVRTAHEMDNQIQCLVKNNITMPERLECFLDDKTYKCIDETNIGSAGLLVGLHPCGDLSATILRSFVNIHSLNALILIGCCYHKLNDGMDKVFRKEWSCQTKKPSNQNAFPLSKEFSSVQLSYAARETACHAVEQCVKNQAETNVFCKTHFYRALLEFALWESDHSDNWRHMSVKGVKEVDTMEFHQYIEKALSEKEPCLEVVRGQLQNRKILDILEHAEDFVEQTMIFYYLRLLFAPIVEDIILNDRVAYLQEAGYTSCVIPLFDPIFSPRNTLIFAHK